MRLGNEIDDFTQTNGSAGYGIIENVVVRSADGSGSGFVVRACAADLKNTDAIGFNINFYFVLGNRNIDPPVTLHNDKINEKTLDTSTKFLAHAGGDPGDLTLLFSEDPNKGRGEGSSSGDEVSIGFSDLQGDTIGSGNDVVIAGLGHDLVYSGAGQDTVFGSLGNDTLCGGTDNDELFGGAGNDFIDLGATTAAARSLPEPEPEPEMISTSLPATTVFLPPIMRLQVAAMTVSSSPMSALMRPAFNNIPTQDFQIPSLSKPLVVWTFKSTTFLDRTTPSRALSSAMAR